MISVSAPLEQPLSYLLFELLVLGLFALCLGWGARRRHLRDLPLRLELVAFTLYGLAFESAAVAAGFYGYAPFTLSLWHTPLVIGLGWATIGFAAMWFSDSLNMPQWSKPFLDALFALLIDVSMDAVAIRERYLTDRTVGGEVTGMWNWGIPLDEEWFGVPYANFMAWFLAVFVMSSSLRAGRYLYRWFTKKWLLWAYPFFALSVALGLFLFALFAFNAAFTLTTLLALLGLSLLVVLLSFKGRQRRLRWSEDLPVFAVPLAFHLFFLSLLLWRRFYLETWWLLLVSIMAFLLSELVVHGPGLARARTREKPS